jgi:hypothetical protein
VVTTAGLLVLSSQFSHRMATASLVLQVSKAKSNLVQQQQQQKQQ